MPQIVDRQKLEKWINETFETYKHYKDDFLINSPFKNDRKFKLSISPSKNCYHCWKTDESGPIWKLVCYMDKCSTNQAYQKIYDQNELIKFESKIDSLKRKVVEIQKENIRKKLEYPEYFKSISLEDESPINKTALEYCKTRKIDPIKWKFGYCYGGRLNRRLIIPFYGPNAELIYWSGRSLYNQEPKYLNASIDKENIVFTNNWDFKGKTIYVVEGALDALSLIELGFLTVAIQGKYLSRYQIELIKESNIVLAFDNDSAGKAAISKTAIFLKQYGINFKYVCPPEGKDWNDSYIKMDNKLKNYILENTKNFDLKSEIIFLLKK